VDVSRAVEFNHKSQDPQCLSAIDKLSNCRIPYGTPGLWRKAQQKWTSLYFEGCIFIKGVQKSSLCTKKPPILLMFRGFKNSSRFCNRSRVLGAGCWSLWPCGPAYSVVSEDEVRL
jgi:hypothetical protein